MSRPAASRSPAGRWLLLALLTACSSTDPAPVGTTTPPPTGSAGASGGAGAGGQGGAVGPAKTTPLALGFGHVCALGPGGTMKCWGDNDHGQLGLGDRDHRGDQPGEMGDALPLVDLGSEAHALSLSLDEHTCALLEKGRIKCWGNNESGQLGLGDTDSRGGQLDEMGDKLPFVDLGIQARVVAVATGFKHTCALLDAGKIRCWGDNAHGQLGLGDVARRGGSPGQMGDTLPPVDLGAGARAVALSVGDDFSCALLDGGRVKCWGRNHRGQLGLSDFDDQGVTAGQMGDDLPFVDLGIPSPVVELATGGRHVCALLDDGRVKCWGDNALGQLGLGDTQDRGRHIGQMGVGLPFVDLGTQGRVVSLAAGDAHTCALLEGGRVKCWGSNIPGELGLGDGQDRGDEAGEMGDALPFVDLGAGASVVTIAAGGLSTCALLTDGRVKCWGDNASGQLGLGDMKPRGHQPGQMGDALLAIDPGIPVGP